MTAMTPRAFVALIATASVTFALFWTAPRAALSSPPGAAVALAPAAVADTFEVKVQQNTPFRVQADRIAHNQMGLILLQEGSSVVAAIQQHQIVYVINLSQSASNTFEIQTYDNSTYTIPGDTLVPEQSGLIRVDGPSGVMGYISNSQLRYVVAVDAKL